MRPTILQAAFLIGAGAGLLAVVVRLTRRRVMSFRFTLAWSAIALTAVAASFLLPVIEPVAKALRFSPAGLLTVVATSVLVAITLQLSVTTSRLQDQLTDLALAHAAAHTKGRLPVDGTVDVGVSAAAGHPRGGTLVLVPAWNEAASIAEVVGELVDEGHEVLVIDDGSLDSTASLAQDAGAEVLRLPINLGVGGALRTGMRYAAEVGFDRVVQCDADGQHPVAFIARLLAEQERTGAHMVVGSRFSHADPGMRTSLLRRTAMRMLARSASRAVGHRMTDASSGFRVIGRPLLDELARTLPNHYLGDTYEVLVAAGRAGYEVREVPVTMRERSHGSSSASTGAALTFTARVLAVVATRNHMVLRQPHAVLRGDTNVGDTR